jgi:hypothetical protein
VLEKRKVYRLRKELKRLNKKEEKVYRLEKELKKA